MCLIVAVISLTGCSAVKNPEQMAASVKDVYTAAQNIETTVNITSHLGEQTMTYQIQYVYQKQEDTSSAVMTVLAPQSIAGITAEITGDDFCFSYADTQLETAMPDRKGYTPVDVTTYLLYDLMHTVPQQVWMEGETLALRFEQELDEGTGIKEVYLNPQTGALTGARIYYNGKQSLQCVFETCTLK